MLLGTMLIIVLLAGAFWWLPQFGANLKRNNDHQLYKRYERWQSHAAEFPLWDARGQKAWEEVRRMEDELKLRGYDMTKLGREALEAKFAGRPIDFSNCRAGQASDMTA